MIINVNKKQWKRVAKEQNKVIQDMVKQINKSDLIRYKLVVKVNKLKYSASQLYDFRWEIMYKNKYSESSCFEQMTFEQMVTFLMGYREAMCLRNKEAEEEEMKW